MENIKGVVDNVALHNSSEIILDHAQFSQLDQMRYNKIIDPRWKTNLWMVQN